MNTSFPGSMSDGLDRLPPEPGHTQPDPCSNQHSRPNHVPAKRRSETVHTHLSLVRPLSDPFIYPPDLITCTPGAKTISTTSHYRYILRHNTFIFRKIGCDNFVDVHVIANLFSSPGLLLVLLPISAILWCYMTERYLF